MKLERRARHKLYKSIRIHLETKEDGIVRICKIDDPAVDLIIELADKIGVDLVSDSEILYLQVGDSENILNAEKSSIESKDVRDELKDVRDELKDVKERLKDLESIKI